MDETSQGPGGFLTPVSIASPASSSTSSRAANSLPHPRNHSLRPGSNKEDYVRRYIEDKLLEISRRYVKKFGSAIPEDTVTGFKSMGEVCRELDGIVNVLWKSGTPSLQIPFLLKIASDFTQYVRSFAPSPRTTLSFLRKLDQCFAGLLSGQDIFSKEVLPGFENGLRAGMTTTDMVRCRSLVEQTRVLMVEILSGGDVEEEEENEEEDDDDSMVEDADNGDAGWDIDDDRLNMDAARIYEHTIVQLGERLGDPLGQEMRVDNSTVCVT